MSQPELQVMMPRLLTEKQASEITGLSQGTLRNWRAEGSGPPYIKMGTARCASIRYDGAELMRYIDQHRRYPSVRAFMEEKRNGTR